MVDVPSPSLREAITREALVEMLYGAFFNRTPASSVPRLPPRVHAQELADQILSLFAPRQALLDEARTELFGLCEATIDEAGDKLATDGLTDHEQGFYRGRKVEAKAISAAMSDVFRSRRLGG